MAKRYLHYSYTYNIYIKQSYLTTSDRISVA